MDDNIYYGKICFYKNVIDNIQLVVYKYKLMKLITFNEYDLCLESIEKIINLINTINHENILNELQYINNNLSSLIKTYGIYNFDYFIKIVLGNDFMEKYFVNNAYSDKFEIIKKYCHVLNYKIISWNDTKIKIKTETQKEISKNAILDDKSIIDSDMLECYDLMRVSNNFNIRVYGIKVILHDDKNKKSININCIIDDNIINNLDSKYIIERKKHLNNFLRTNNLFKNELFVSESWNNYYNNLTVKDYLIYSAKDLFNKYIYIMNRVGSYQQKTLNSLVQEFIGSELFNQRTMLIQLLLNGHKQELQYISYLLYDILSNDNQHSSDSDEQKLLYNSLTWNCKKHFKDAMYKTIEYTTNLSNFDNNKIPLEQQICLMKVKDSVKEKAMQKLKEIKAKSEDSGSKSRQYLDGLLKIPFGIYKEEYILSKKKEILETFNYLIDPLKEIEITKLKNNSIFEFMELLKDLLSKNAYNSIEILNIVNIIEKNMDSMYLHIVSYFLNHDLNNLKNQKKSLNHVVLTINNNIKNNNYKLEKINATGNITALKKNILDFTNKNIDNKEITKYSINLVASLTNDKIINYLINTEKTIVGINNKNTEIIEYINSFNEILNSSVHGHKNAKKQIERIVGQWINGEKSGYCFGFEGPPGLGKTSLAKKGLSKCLNDKNGESRPFAFIALGGSSNGSILDGHNYTYVGSTWGKIVDILIENKCMNPIIFIDELDKVSKTEHGKEIIGILTHLVDSTQNDGFQDKYFSNIDLDLSKALFVFSYNDAELIDKILLDRIHRIKFDNLLLDDKIVVVKDFLLPELYTKFGLENIIVIDDENIKFIIETYTNEPGVRKLKEILFEIISTINLDLLKKSNKYNIPIIITKEIVEEILIERQSIRILKINSIPKVGVINGMWANAYGMSGILHIEARFFSTSTFLDLKLTGMQGDVMKESMCVAKTLAISLFETSVLKKKIKEMEDTKRQGIHIHIPEGATPKDGPSAGAAITLVLYSLLTNKKIKNNYAITGEITLQGKITAIGGLELKILGGIKAGVNTFLYPKENALEFKIFCEKHKEESKMCEFYEVDHINDAIKHIII